jgi:hypothetical protein
VDHRESVLRQAIRRCCATGRGLRIDGPAGHPPRGLSIDVPQPLDNQTGSVTQRMLRLWKRLRSNV